MNIFDTTAGAKFVRADLHIHSFGEGGSFDVKDSLMTPESIVDTAIEKGLSVISITDHNEVGNVKAAVDHASGKDILVIPGVEIATTQGHLLVYFEKVSEAVTFRGKLAISDDKTICTQGICECLSLAATLGGVGILAHIELDSGFEKTINRFGPQMEAVFTHTSLMGLEITKKDSSIFYTDKDENANR
ncbi:MAG TPA: PHP domain-containing protein, partial [Pyrinomonadaceae bacterium]